MAFDLLRNVCTCLEKNRVLKVVPDIPNLTLLYIVDKGLKGNEIYLNLFTKIYLLYCGDTI